MSKESQAQSLHPLCKEPVGWDKAVYAMEEKIKSVEGKLAGLRAALAVCKERPE